MAKIHKINLDSFVDLFFYTRLHLKPEIYKIIYFLLLLVYMFSMQFSSQPLTPYHKTENIISWKSQVLAVTCLTIYNPHKTSEYLVKT